MAGSVNKVILVGSLGADPEIRRTQDGVDQYSTEVVLQGFNCRLEMLDAKPGSQGQAQSGQQGGGFGGVNDTGHGQPGGGGYGAGSPGGGGKNFDKDLDDEIPFVFKEITCELDTV